MRVLVEALAGWFVEAAPAFADSETDRGMSLIGALYDFVEDDGLPEELRTSRPARNEVEGSPRDLSVEGLVKGADVAIQALENLRAAFRKVADQRDYLSAAFGEERLACESALAEARELRAEVEGQRVTMANVRHCRDEALAELEELRAAVRLTELERDEAKAARADAGGVQ